MSRVLGGLRGILQPLLRRSGDGEAEAGLVSGLRMQGREGSKDTKLRI